MTYPMNTATLVEDISVPSNPGFRNHKDIYQMTPPFKGVEYVQVSASYKRGGSSTTCGVTSWYADISEVLITQSGSGRELYVTYPIKSHKEVLAEIGYEIKE